MISLLLHKSEAKSRTSFNNKDIIQMYLGYNLLFSLYNILVITCILDFTSDLGDNQDTHTGV